MKARDRSVVSRRTVLKGAFGAATTLLAACGESGDVTAETEATAQPGIVPPGTGTEFVPAAPQPVSRPGPPAQAGIWQQLTVAPHQRKLISESFSTGDTFDPSVAVMIDARAESSVSAIPWRSFCRPVMGEPGVLYYTGSLHSNYPGNEIDRIDLRNLASAQITTSINHQPVVPPRGTGSGYGSGSGSYVYRQYGAGLVDPSMWMPYAHHTWTKNSWHPTWGVVLQVVGASSDGATTGANPLGQSSVPGYQVPTKLAGQKDAQQALVSYEWSERKYKVRLNPVPRVDGDLTQAAGPGPSGASDWNQHTMSMLFLRNFGGNTYVYELVDTQRVPALVFSFNQAALSGNTWGWFDDTGGSGVLLKWLEGWRYLGLRADGNKALGDPVSVKAYNTLFLINLQDETKVRAVTPPAYALSGVTPSADGNFTFAVDRHSRRIFWLVYSAHETPGAMQTVRLYVSTFDAPETWTEILADGLPTITNNAYEYAWLASKREALWFYNGHLFTILPEGGGLNDPGYTNGAINVWRVNVDGAGMLPPLEFKRYDYWAQNPATNGFRFSNMQVATLQMIGTKHVNWAFRPADGKYYQHAGDFGMSTCQSMCTLNFDATSRGYTFTEILNEVGNPPSGKVRPSSPDDGYWFHVPTDSAWVAGRGKFVWMRGGDGEPMFYNAVLRAKYGASDSNGTAGQIAAARADGWDITSKFYVFDPASPSQCFDRIAGTGWTQDNGSTFWPDVWTASSASSRNGYFDPTTGCLWRFYNFGSIALARFDFVNLTVKVFNISSWVSEESGRTIFLDGGNPNAVADLVADGAKPLFCWYDSAHSRFRTFGEFSWEHKATWIDPATGYLYVVSPGTGYLWRFDTRGTHTSTSDGWRIPFSPVGGRIPLVGTYPTLNSRTTWPPAIFNGDVKMNSLLLPFKGGLLWLSSLHHDSGVSGVPHYAFWRALGDTGPWSVVTMPQEFAANSGAAKYAYSIDNDELLLISQAWTDSETRQFYRYFWKLT